MFSLMSCTTPCPLRTVESCTLPSVNFASTKSLTGSENGGT
ncbi:hypothetical protein [Streptomyces griseofuscus]